jgi:hypothetical protein
MIQSFASTVVPLQGDGGVELLFVLLSLAFLVLTVAGTWMTFEKAGRPGWGAIIPIFNTYLMLKIGGNSGWWLLGLLVPVVNFFVALKMMIDVADSFGRGFLFGLGLAFLSFVFWPLLGFGDDTYRGPGGETIHEEWA